MSKYSAGDDVIFEWEGEYHRGTVGCHDCSVDHYVIDVDKSTGWRLLEKNIVCKAFDQFSPGDFVCVKPSIDSQYENEFFARSHRLWRPHEDGDHWLIKHNETEKGGYSITHCFTINLIPYTEGDELPKETMAIRNWQNIQLGDEVVWFMESDSSTKKTKRTDIVSGKIWMPSGPYFSFRDCVQSVHAADVQLLETYNALNCVHNPIIVDEACNINHEEVQKAIDNIHENKNKSWFCSPQEEKNWGLTKEHKGDLQEVTEFMNKIVTEALGVPEEMLKGSKTWDNPSSSDPIGDIDNWRAIFLHDIVGNYGPNHEENGEKGVNCPQCDFNAPVSRIMITHDAVCPRCGFSPKRCRHKSCRGLLVKTYNNGKWGLKCQDCYQPHEEGWYLEL